MHTIKKASVFFLCLCLILTAAGCAGSSGGTQGAKGKGTRSAEPVIRTPSADGAAVYANEAAAIDASHADAGYIMVSYTGSNAKVKMQITLPDATVYTYDLHGGWEVFPLTGGSGSYKVVVLENAYANQYTTALSQTVDATMADEFGPYLYPSQYVWYTADSAVVPLSRQLAEGADTDLDVITSVYNYVTQNIAYDNDQAQNTTSGYLPDVDDVIARKKGICFDYAALMAALLRLQNIPTRLEIGYSGSAYHAWISAYTKEQGWVSGIIQFDGSTWTLMDPTLGANNDNESVKKYIGDGSHYVTKYLY